ncbi:hypothetical protein FKM82_031164, partial [Ascaphus truei]
FSSAGDVTFLAICTDSVPSAVAFSFLEELQWEFSVSCSSTSVALASRPYAFLGFDRVIQRVKHNFNFARSPPVHLDPSPPPVIVRLEDVEDVNVIVNGYSTLPMQSAPNYRMTPVTALGILSLTLNIMCGALSLIRGVHLAEHSFQVTRPRLAWVCGVKVLHDSGWNTVWVNGSYLTQLFHHLYDHVYH